MEKKLIKKRTQELKKQKIFFNSIVENIPDMIFVKDAKDLKFELLNKAGEKLLGQKREKMIGKSDYDFFPKSEANFFVKKDREVLRSKKLVDIHEEPIKTKSGVRFLHTKKIPLFDEKGHPEFLLGISEDITNEKKLGEQLKFYTEGKIKESEEKFRNIFENANDAIWLIKGSKFIDCNLQTLKIFGLNNKKEIIGRHPADFSPVKQPNGKNSKKESLAYIRKALTGKVQKFLWEHKQKDGTQIFMEISLNIIVVEGKKYVQAIGHDITDRLKAEEALKIKNYIFDNSPYANSIADSQAILTEVNKSFLDMLGFKSKREVLGKPVSLFFKNKKESVKLLGELKKTGRWIGATKARKKDGTDICIYGLITKLFDNNNKFIGYQSSTYDITRAREIEEQYKNYVEMTPRGAHIFDLENNKLILRSANPAADKILGVNHKKLLNKTISHAFPGLKSTKIPEIYLRVAHTGKSWQGKVPYDAAGIKGCFDVVAFRLSDNKIAASFVDISKEREAELAIKKRDEELGKKVQELNAEKNKLEGLQAQDEAMLLSIGDGVVVVDKNKKIILINSAAQKMLNLKKDEAKGKYLEEIWGITDNKGNILAEGKRPISLALKGRTTASNGLTFFYVRKNGSKFPVALAVAPVRVGNKIVGAIDVFRDITREIELDKAKDDFLSMASHQLRTPLSGTKWVLESLIEDKTLDLTPRQREKLEDINSSNERLINLVNDLLSVTRIEAGKIAVNKIPTDLENLIGDIVTSVKILVDKKKKIIKINWPPKLEKIYCDPNLAKEAIENILVNAIIYSNDNSPEIEVEVKSRPRDYLISIHNDGTVSPNFTNKNIFDKFVRGPKASGKSPTGSGLGLYITKRVVEANGGTIWFESDPKTGTTFYFTLKKL